MSRRRDHENSEQMAGIFQRDPDPKSYTKDFQKQNLAAMRQKEEATRKRLQDAQTALPKPEWKLKQFANVESKMNQAYQ